MRGSSFAAVSLGPGSGTGLGMGAVEGALGSLVVTSEFNANPGTNALEGSNTLN